MAIADPALTAARATGAGEEAPARATAEVFYHGRRSPAERRANGVGFAEQGDHFERDAGLPTFRPAALNDGCRARRTPSRRPLTTTVGDLLDRALELRALREVAAAATRARAGGA